MKKFLLKSLFLLCALVVGSQCGWAADYEVTYNKAALASMLSGDYLDATSYWKVPGAAGGSATIAIPITYQPTSDITITFNIATFGSGTNPSNSNTTITAVGTETSSNWSGSTVSTYPSSSTYVDGVMTITKPASPTTLGGLTITMGVNSGIKIFRLSSIKVSYTYTVSSDPSSEVSFANATPSFDLKDAATYTQVATTVDGYSTTPGASVTYSISGSNTALATIDENTGEVTPTQAGSVTVTANAAAIDGHFAASNASYTLTVTDTREWDVTCHIGNNTIVETRTSGATLSLDNPSPICGMSFLGWSSTNNAASPTWVANTTKVTANMDVYAIFQAVAGEYSYRLVEANLADWRGDFLIAYDDETFADGRKGGTDNGCIGKQNVHVDPSTNLSGKVVDVTWGDTYNVTIEALNDNKLSDGYVLKTKDGKYNYQSSNSNGLTATDNKTTASAYPISVTFTSSSDVKLCLGGAASGAVFRYNTNGYFRFYKDGAQNAVYLYKRTEDKAPVYSLGITEEITIGVSKYATYCSTQALSFATTDVKAYKAKVTDNKVVLTKVDAVPANEGVILFCDVAGDYDIPVIPAADDVTENELIGVNTKTKIAYDGAGSKKNYILANGASGVGFYKASTTGANLAAHKAYLSTENAVTAREFLGFGEETTGVSDVRGKIEDGICDFFDLQGRKVAQPTKGLYIVNGKKVIIK